MVHTRVTLADMLTEQLDAVRADSLRVLVVGAGVAGRTLAGLLRRAGLHPVVVDRSAPDAGTGYMLAMMPLVDPVLADLGVTDTYVERSVPLRRYRIRDRAGRPAREYPMGELLDRFGDYRGLSRGALLDVLGAAGGPVGHRIVPRVIDQDGAVVRAALADHGEAVEFDLVVAADGMHSATRAMVLPEERVQEFDTGWSSWVNWLDPDPEFADLGEELWGDGFFIGTYPVRDALGVIVCAPRARIDQGPERLTGWIRSRLRRPGGHLERVLAETTLGAGYRWDLVDRRAADWSVGRVALLGDAAAGFLPTAGIGACMAMESAWMLAGHLRGIPRERVPEALRAYERAQRPRVEAAQRNSRQLARLVFGEGWWLPVVRDTATRVLPVRAALGPIRKLLNTRPPVPVPLSG
ncbi:FAD-dependent monooxygenase [Pseudonocardia eucalypti]|uniref:FAD-dependent monooxygenase n=2 Tax=Pseudonocardia eucalypti TaxID=648755 RepID=A0ABP9PVZ0_9PSEU